MLELEVKANREHKDSMFREYFSEKEKLLKLYNAINKTNYDDVSQIKLTTLGQIMWMGRKNDISFLLEDRLIIFTPHQSTINGNMPVRALGFAGRVYEIIIPDDELYGTKQTPLPTPEFYVFYNGTDPHPKEKTLRLSDAFINPAPGEQFLETIVKVININYDIKSDILERSEDLKGYSYFVHLVREYMDNGRNLSDAIELAVMTCIEKNILAEFLKKHRTEVINMLDWDIEKYKKAMRKEGREEGREERDFEIAKSMLFDEMPFLFISKHTGLSLEELETIDKGIKQSVKS